MLLILGIVLLVIAIAGGADLTKYIDRIRGLGIPVDTDLAVLWGRAP